MTTLPDEITLVPEKTQTHLNNRQLASYREHRRNLLTWMLDRGKDPARKQGYAVATVSMRAYHLDRLYRMVWTAEEHYTEDITVDHADAWMEWLADQDLSTSYKASCQKAAATLFNWKS